MLETFAGRLWPFSRLAAWKHGIDGNQKQLRKELRSISNRLGDIERLLEATALRAEQAARAAEQVRLTLALDGQQRGNAPPHGRLDEARVRAHVEQAIAASPLLTDPFEHIVVDNLVPPDVYELMLEARPPEAFFDPRDPAKQDLRMPMAAGPALMKAVWAFVDDTLAMRIIRPAVLEKFDAALRRHVEEAFGPGLYERVLALPPSRSSARLALRRPGYALAPHRDPKRSMLTCLIYLAAPGDEERYGTQLYRVTNDSEAHYKQTYFPEQEGATCALVKTVPFRPNSMLVFLNSRGAHGAAIPPDAPPTERYTFQFYVAPDTEALRALLRSLPADRRSMWANKGRVAQA